MKIEYGQFIKHDQETLETNKVIRYKMEGYHFAIKVKNMKIRFTP